MEKEILKSIMKDLDNAVNNAEKASIEEYNEKCYPFMYGYVLNAAREAAKRLNGILNN